MNNGLNTKMETLPQKKQSRVDMRKYIMFFALIGIWLIFTALTGGTFILPRNLSNLTRQMTFTAILAMGMMGVILVGEIDLSVGSLVGLCGGVFAIVTKQHGVPLVPALLLTLLLGTVLGFWNGWWTAYQAMPSFIVTLAGQLVFRGVLVGLTGGKTIAPLDDRMQWISSYIDVTASWIVAGCAVIVLLICQWSAYTRSKEMGLTTKNITSEIAMSVLTTAIIAGFVLIMNAYKGIPRAVYLIVVLFVTFYIFTQKTVFGRRLYAIGGNKAASRLVGINVKRNVLVVFAINGLIAGIAAIFLCARLNSAAVSAGTSAETDAIAACVIGGASMMGGVTSLPGVLVGAAVMASIDNGMALLDTPAFWQTIIKGIVLLLAVWADMSKKKH